MPCPDARRIYPHNSAKRLNGFKLSNASNRLAWPFPDEADEFLIAVGAADHFLQSTSSVADCPHHDWTTCHSDAHATPQAILASSIQPAAFFPSGTVHHCASQIVHDSRRQRCHLAGFETHLCCRACALQSDCWTAEELRALPCGVLRTAPPAAPAPTRKPRRKRSASVERTVKSP
jgi:hypothetical protein